MNEAEAHGATEAKPQLENHVYEINHKPVTLEIRAYHPSAEVTNLQEAVIHFPAWAGKASPSIDTFTHELAEGYTGRIKTTHGYAAKSTRTAFSITTKNPDQPLYAQAQAALEFVTKLVKDRGVRTITLSGHSEGAIKAVDLAVLLQQAVERGDLAPVTLNGLVLIAPMGAYAQKYLGVNFVREAVPDTLRKIFFGPTLKGKRGKLFQTWWEVGTDVATNALGEIVHAGIGAVSNIQRQVGESATKNPLMEQVACPVVVFMGVDDRISSMSKFAPTEEMENILEAWPEAEQSFTDVDTKGAEVKKQYARAVLQARARNQYLKEHVFKTSPFVDTLVATKFARRATKHSPERVGHIVAHWRAEEIARVALRRLDEAKKPTTRPFKKPMTIETV